MSEVILQGARRDASSKSQPIHIGLIGLGSNGQVHYDALTNPRQHRFKLVAAADPKPRIEVPNIPLVPDYTVLLAREDIAAITVNTPPYLHFEMTMNSLNAGKHVLVEKPPALTQEQCHAMIGLAQQKHKVLFMAFHIVYHPEIFEARRRLQGKPVKAIDIVFKENLLEYHDPKGWILDPARGGGGVLMDSGVNALSVVNYVLPDLSLAVQDAHFRYPDHLRVETAADIRFAFGKGTEGYIELDWEHKGTEVREISFGTTEGRYTIDITNSQLRLNGENIPRSSFDKKVGPDDMGEYDYIYEDFAKHIAQGKSFTSTKELSFILDSYAKGKP